jgi:hypothetical protein
MRTYEGEVTSRRVRARGYAPLFFRTGRRQVDAGEAKAARASFASSLRYWRGQGAVQSARALAWIAVLTLPGTIRDALAGTLVKLKRSVEGLLGNRKPARA